MPTNKFIAICFGPGGGTEVTWCSTRERANEFALNMANRIGTDTYVAELLDTYEMIPQHKEVVIANDPTTTKSPK